MSDLGLGHFDNINRMITLYVITLSGFHCITIPNWNDPTKTVLIKKIFLIIVFKNELFKLNRKNIRTM